MQKKKKMERGGMIFWGEKGKWKRSSEWTKTEDFAFGSHHSHTIAGNIHQDLSSLKKKKLIGNVSDWIMNKMSVM
jgi:hypothetical protein